MGFFDQFKKNTDKSEKAVSTPAQPETATADKPENLLIEPTLDRKELLAMVAEKCAGGEMQNDSLWYPEYRLRLKLEFGQMAHGNNMYNVQLLFIVQHPWFDEEMVESCAGVGKTPDEAMKRGTENFCAVVFTFLLAAFKCDCDNWLTADIMGRKCNFRIPCTRANMHMGDGESVDLWELIKDEIPHYLGTKRCYWVKLFSSSLNGIPNCEARINGIVYPDLTEILEKDVISRNHAISGFSSDKTFILLIQKEETYQPCPFTKQEVGELTFRAIRLYQNVDNEESRSKTDAMVRELAPNDSVAMEVISFLPEIFAHMVVQFRDNDTLIPVVNRGKPEIELKKSQVRSYGYIEDAVEQYLRKQRPSKEEINQILAMSAKFHAISEAIQNGAKIENLRLSQLVYFVNEKYIPW